MGYLGRDGTLDLNILIRTLVVRRWDIEFRTGAGIVADSARRPNWRRRAPRPAGMLRALGGEGMIGRRLVNGVEASAIAADDRGLQYGDGLFETMAAVDGRVRHFAAALARLLDGCAALGHAGARRRAWSRTSASACWRARCRRP